MGHAGIRSPRMKEQLLQILNKNAIPLIIEDRQKEIALEIIYRGRNSRNVEISDR